MGTAAADRGPQRSGDGVSPGACRRTRSPLSRRKNSRRAGPSGHVCAAPSRTGRRSPSGVGRDPQGGHGQGGWYRGAAAGGLRPSGDECGRPTAARRPAGGAPDHAAPRQHPPLPGAARGDRPARHGARDARALAGRQGVRALPGADGRGAAVDLLRRAADRQRHAGRASHRGPRLQGRLPPVQDHAGLLCATPGGLGLSWPAGRGGGGEGARAVGQEGHRGLRGRRLQRALP